MDGNHKKIVDAARHMKNILTMRMVLDKYGFEGGRGNRIPCPLHHGKDRNFEYKDRSFRCYVCGAHGTIIDFVESYFNVGFEKSVKILNEDFGLGLRIEAYFSGEEKTRLKARSRKANNNREFERYKEKLLDDLARCMYVANHAWKTKPLEGWTPQEVKAVQMYQWLEIVSTEIEESPNWEELLTRGTGADAKAICREILGQ